MHVKLGRFLAFFHCIGAVRSVLSVRFGSLDTNIRVTYISEEGWTARRWDSKKVLGVLQ